MIQPSPKRRSHYKANYQTEASWQKHKKSRNHSKSFINLLPFVSIIIVFLFLFLAFKTWQFVRHSKWDGQSRINVLLVGSSLRLFSFNPKEDELVLLTAPATTEIEVIHGYGRYPLGSVAKLEAQEKRQGLLLESLEENFGLPIDGWLKTDDGIKDQTNLSQLLREKIFADGETSLSRWDLTRIWWQVRKLRFDKTKYVDLGKSGVLINKVLADQTSVWEIDRPSLDDRFERLFFEPKIREERLSIEVLNGTSYPGLADRVALTLANIGGEVVMVENGEPTENCQIKTIQGKKNTYTVRRIQEIYDCKWQEKNEEGRAEITLIMGNNYLRKLTER